MVANWVTNYCDVCIIYFAGEFKSWGISQGGGLKNRAMCNVYCGELFKLRSMLSQLVSKIPFVCSVLCRAGTGA